MQAWSHLSVGETVENTDVFDQPPGKGSRRVSITGKSDRGVIYSSQLVTSDLSSKSQQIPLQ